MTLPWIVSTLGGRLSSWYCGSSTSSGAPGVVAHFGEEYQKYAKKVARLFPN
jgi:hypothetical protein